MGAIDCELAKTKLDYEKISESEDGKFLGIEDQVRELKKEYGFLFEDKPRILGIEPANVKNENVTDPFLEGFGK